MSSQTSLPTDHGLGHQHSACENCRAKKLKCSGQRPYCRRCMLKNIHCQYPLPEGRKRKTQTEETAASRQAASAARSRRVNDAIPHELQGVFSVNLGDVTQPLPPPPKSTGTPLNQPPADSPCGGGGTEGPQLDNHGLANGASDHSIESPRNNSGSSSCPGLSQDSSLSSLDGSTSLSWVTSDMTGPSGMSPMSFDFDIEAFESTTLSLTGSKSPDWGNMGTNQRCPFTPNFDTTSLQPEKGPPSPQHSCANPTPQTHTNQNSSTCHCFETASSLLERWETRKHDSLDGLLKFQKATVYQLGSFLACQRCSTLSAFMMLPLLMCEKLISSSPLVQELCSHTEPSRCQELCKAITTLAGSQSAAATPSSIRSTDSGLRGNNNNIMSSNSAASGPKLPLAFGEYDIESQQEWQSISEVLIMFQFRQLGGLLERYKSIAASLGWQTQLGLVVDLQKRLQGVTRKRWNSLEKIVNAP